MPSFTQGDSSIDGAPTKVTAITTDAGAIISFVPPANQAAVTNYTVIPYLNGVAGSPQTISGSNQTVTSLTNSVFTGTGTTGSWTTSNQYQFTVKTNFANGSISRESVKSGVNYCELNKVFGDEFKNANCLDPHWVAITRDSDQSNSELNYYQPANAFAAGDSMRLLIQNIPTTGTAYSDTSYPAQNYNQLITRNYRSAMIQTSPTPAFLYTSGKTLSIRANALMPTGCGTSNSGGMWPAIWLLGANCQLTNLNNPDNVSTCNWPASGSDEIDIAEFGGGGTTGGGSNTSFKTNAYIAGSNVFGVSNAVSDASVNWHEYRLDWSVGSLKWFLDGVQVQTLAQAPSTAMFLLINCAVAGAPSGAAYPSTMNIDYIRIYNS